MALVNRTTGESARVEAERALSSPTTSSPPQNEPQVLSWQTLNHLNKLELENSLLKQSLTELQGEMNRLTEQQTSAIQQMNTTLESVSRFVNDCSGQVNRLSDSNRQLQSGIDTAMNRAVRELNQGTVQTLMEAESTVHRVSVSYIHRMEQETKQAIASFHDAESTIRQFTSTHVWLMVALYGSLIGNLAGCIYWFITLFQ